MIIEIEVAGEVADRQELLNGTQSVTLEGRDASGAWTLVGGVSWNRGLRDYAGEGDINLSRDDGAEIFGTVVRSEALAEVTEEGELEIRMSYEIDGGSGAFERAAGRASGTVRLGDATFTGTWRVEIEGADTTN